MYIYQQVSFTQKILRYIWINETLNQVPTENLSRINKSFTQKLKLSRKMGTNIFFNTKSKIPLHATSEVYIVKIYLYIK
jgi:hypothetical protein